MGVFEELAKKDHEQIIFCHDEDSGLKAVVSCTATMAFRPESSSWQKMICS